MTSNAYLLDSTGHWLGAGSPPVLPPPTWPPVVASYKPGSTTTGVRPGIGLTTSGNITTVMDGQVIEEKDVHGFIFIRHQNCIVRNCRVRGGAATGHTGLINCMSNSVRNLQIYDVTLRVDPALVSRSSAVFVDGVFGANFTCRRANISYVNDCFGTHNSGFTSTDLAVTIEANWCHEPAMLSPDPETRDVVGGKAVGWTHNDCIQVQGCGPSAVTQVYSHGNNFDWYPCAPFPDISNFKSSWWPSPTGSGIAITPNVNQVHHIVSEDDWFNGGQREINVNSNSKGVGAGMRFRRGKFGRDAHYPEPIRIDPTCPVEDMPATSGGLDKAEADGGSGNVWADGSGFIPVVYGAGTA